MPEIISLADAKRAGLTHYYTGKPCLRGHVALRRVSGAACCSCVGAHHATYCSRHPGRHAALVRAQYEAYPERAGASRAIRINPEALTGVEEASACAPFYAEARRLSRETNVPHEVDHIIPLSRGGKHEASNLQVLTAVANRAKSDSTLPYGTTLND